MATTLAYAVPDYQRFRAFFAVIVSVVWFVLLLGFGSLVALQLPGGRQLPFRFAWCFFLVGFFPICMFAAPATLIGFLQQYLAGAFTPPPASTAPKLQAANSQNPWRLSLQRLVLYWLPAVLLATLGLWLTFPDGIGRGTMVRLSPQQRAWHASFLSYLVWRHGVPWGIGNGVISAVLAMALFPRAPDNAYGVMPPEAVSLDIFFTSFVLCFFMAISAHPHAWVDARLGVIRTPARAHSPTRRGRISWFVGASLGLGGGVMAVLKGMSSAGLTVWEFVVWKGLATTLIAGVAAMATAYWTVARERAAVEPV